MRETTLEVKFLTESEYKLFEELYNDFRTRAVSEYRFELEPLSYEDFLEAVQKELINCLILKEYEKPVAFLVYTTAISEAIELNIIHSLNMQNIIQRCKLLTERFLTLTKEERKEKVVCYPMLGAQKTFIGELARYGFKFVGIAVLRFMMEGTNSREILKLTQLSGLDDCYKIVPWNDMYFDDAVEIVQSAFETSADALFDPRFLSLEGTHDILTKIVKNLYAEFLPEATSILLCNDIPVGFSFVNLTGGTIANIPIVAIKKEHQGKGLSKYMLKRSIEQLLHWVDHREKHIIEVNTNTETNNFQALKMYRHLGFKEDYNYPQSYLQPSK